MNAPRLPWFPIVLVLVALVAAAWPPLTQAFMYDRALVAQGEVWRLITASLVHLTWGHTVLNLGGLLLVWLLFGPNLSQRAWLTTWLISALLVGVLLFFHHPEVQRYVGLSGVLHGLFVSGALAELPRDRRWAITFLAVLAAKLTYEQLLGPLPGSEASAGGPVLVEAHLYGALGGIPVGLWGAWRNRQSGD